MRIAHEQLADCTFDEQLTIELFKTGRPRAFGFFGFLEELIRALLVTLEEAYDTPRQVKGGVV
ncbi:hypothetical protein D3C87_1752630 [compost metagenome]